MTARERLIELLLQTETFTADYAESARLQAEYKADHLLANGAVVVDMNVVSPKNRPLISQFMGRPIDEIIELVNAKDEGRIIVPPCKVGDTVYRIVKLLNGETKIVEGEVLEIAITHEHHGGNECRFYFWVKGEEFTRRHYSIWCYFADFGKTVFLSRELAEKALAERSNQ